MGTPGAPEQGAHLTLYGEGDHSINRRTLIGGAAALFSLPVGARKRNDNIERAMAAMGGSTLLSRVRALRWIGTAKVFARGKAIHLGVETSFEPFRRARSDSWLASEGRSQIRTLMIEGAQGFRVVEGRQSALSPADLLNERQQFGAYGYLLMAGSGWRAHGRGALRGTHKDFPAIDLRCGTDGRIVAADYLVAPPEDSTGIAGKPIREHFTFSGTVADKGLRWPKRIAIAQNGRPFFDLSIDQLWVDLH
jgi:hypothetical protein